MNNILEEDCIKALSKNDQKAFELLFLHYQPKLIYFIKGFIKDSELARDMSQEVFLNIWKNREQLQDLKSFKAYIFKMGKNAVCNHFDHLLVKERFVLEKKLNSPDFENIEETIYAKQLQDLIDITVSQMPPRRKEIYILSRVEGMSNDQIADELKINKRTVENHLTAALADLRKTIGILLLFISDFFY